MGKDPKEAMKKDSKALKKIVKVGKKIPLAGINAAANVADGLDNLATSKNINEATGAVSDIIAYGNPIGAAMVTGATVFEDATGITIQEETKKEKASKKVKTTSAAAVATAQAAALQATVAAKKARGGR